MSGVHLLLLGAGINADNAGSFIEAGASHVIVTSYVFRDGKIDYDRLSALVDLVGKKHLVLDLSCRKKIDEDGNSAYYIVTDRWQKYTDTELNLDTLEMLKSYADEYLIHAVDVEGKKAGIDKELISILGSWDSDVPVTYAGGVSSFEDLDAIKELGKGRVDVTIGSALSIFGGNLDLNEVLEYLK